MRSVKRFDGCIGLKRFGFGFGTGVGVGDGQLFDQTLKLEGLLQLKLFCQTIKALSDVVDSGRIGKKTVELFWLEVFEQCGQNCGKISMGWLRLL